MKKFTFKKLIPMLFFVLSTTGAAFAQSGYFTGDGAKDKRILVSDSNLVNGKPDKSDEWICLTIKNSIINDLICYSNMNVIDSGEIKNNH